MQRTLITLHAQSKAVRELIGSCCPTVEKRQVMIEGQVHSKWMLYFDHESENELYIYLDFGSD